MMKQPKIKKPDPPANPPTQADARDRTSTTSPFLAPYGLLTSSSGAVSRAATSKKSLTGV